MKPRFTTLIIIILLFSATGIVTASEILNAENCTIAEDATVEGDLFVLCGQLIVNGQVNGNIIGAARSAFIRGEVAGGLYILSGELLVEGAEIGQDVHFAGLTLDLTDNMQFTSARGGVISANLSTIIDPDVHVPGSINQVGYQLVINGEIENDITFWGSALSLGGVINGDIRANVGDAEAEGTATQIETLLVPLPFEVSLIDPGLRVLADAQITGQLEYTAPSPATIEGEVDEVIYRTTQQSAEGATPVEQSAQSLQRGLANLLREFGTLGLIGLIFIIAAPRYMKAPIRVFQSRPISTLGVGLISFILSFPIVLVMAVLSIAIVFILYLLPLDTFAIFGGVVLGLANIGTASVFYFTAIYIARLVVALALGRFLVRLFWKDDDTWRYLLVSMAVGVFLLALLSAVPVVGFVVNAFALFLGLGAIMTLLRQQIERFLEAGDATARSYDDQTVPSLPARAGSYEPYILDDQITPAGMHDLPQGFDWWGQSNDGDDEPS